MDGKGQSSARVLVCLLVMSSMLLATPVLCQQSPRTIHVLLTRAVTQGAGIHGQPVTSYYAPMKIGTPAKSFNVQFDTALGDSFVPQYDKFPKNVNLHYGKGYKCEDSSSCSNQHHAYVIKHQQCKLTADQYTDAMSFGEARDENGSRIEESLTVNHTFLAASNAEETTFKYLPIDGLFALAPKTRPQVPNFFHSLADSIDNSRFSFWFSKGAGDTPYGGEVVFGGEERSHMDGETSWNPISNNDQYNFALQLNNVTLGADVVSCHGTQCLAILSTGSDVVVGPREDVERIYKLLNTTSKDNLEYVDCDRVSELPALTFGIGSGEYPMPASKYVRKTASSGEGCYLAIEPSSSEGKEQWVLGTHFLESFQTTFDVVNHRIGFAAAK